MGPLLAILAELGIEGAKAFMGHRAQDKNAKRQAQQQAMQALQQNLNQQPLGTDQKVATSPFDYTNLDDQMQAALFNQIFKGLLSPKATGVPSPAPDDTSMVAWQ